MGKLLDFASKNYIFMIILSFLLIFALVGYFVKRKQGDDAVKSMNEKPQDAIDFSNIKVDSSLSLNQMVNNSTKDVQINNNAASVSFGLSQTDNQPDMAQPTVAPVATPAPQPVAPLVQQPVVQPAVAPVAPVAQPTAVPVQNVAPSATTPVQSVVTPVTPTAQPAVAPVSQPVAQPAVAPVAPVAQQAAPTTVPTQN